MNEALLQFIWRYSLYQPVNLYTTEGEPITIVFPGYFNANSGPDFLEAKVNVGNTLLVGNIELHVNSTDFIKHKHQDDAAYKNLILHVVYKNNPPLNIAHVPLLVLAPHIPDYVQMRYKTLLQAKEVLPCAAQLGQIKDIIKESWLHSLLALRWEQKLGDWKIMLHNGKDDWHDLLYWRLAANFGFKVNADPFISLAKSLPLKILAKHRTNIFQLEALLFGQAGMLHAQFKEDYPKALFEAYVFLKHKYKLQPLEAHRWRFLRMRPGNFPSIRMAQFAALVHDSLHLFSKIIETDSVLEISKLMQVSASEYWNDHYILDVPADKQFVKTLGEASVQNIIINTIAPIKFLYAFRQGNSAMQEAALQLLDVLPAEKNSIINFWQQHGWHARNAADSQALIELHNNFCKQKRCLDCAIGLNIIRLAPVKD